VFIGSKKLLSLQHKNLAHWIGIGWLNMGLRIKLLVQPYVPNLRF